MNQTTDSPIDNLREKIRTSMEVVDIELIDDSHRHAGHAGSRAGGNTHFRLRVVSDAFAGLSQIERHRMVYAILSDEMAGQIHALNIVARTPDEEHKD